MLVLNCFAASFSLIVALYIFCVGVMSWSDFKRTVTKSGHEEDAKSHLFLFRFCLIFGAIDLLISLYIFIFILEILN